MMLTQIRTLNLQGQLAFHRVGWIKIFVFMICMVGLTAWLWGIPQLHTQQKTLRLQSQRAQQSLRVAEVAAPVVHTPREVHFNQFMEGLGDERYTEQQLKTLFVLAEKSGLLLAQADYQLAEDKNGRYRTYQVLLPVKGTYSAIRQFCEQVLLAIPFAALDEMNFKRDAIGNGTLEARLRITIYLSALPSATSDNDKPRLPKDTS